MIARLVFTFLTIIIAFYLLVSKLSRHQMRGSQTSVREMLNSKGNTCYTGVMQISARPNAKSISNGEWTRFIFISGRLCIDFTQTGGETGKRAAWERFHAPSDLADWF